MIEVEKKFKLSERQKTKLIEGAEKISEKTFTDTYFDSPEYTLTTKDIWLRQRGDVFELKVAMQFGYDRKADQYDEITDPKAIREKLGVLNDTGDLAKDLEAQNILPFVSCTTARMKYSKGGFTIDMDTVSYSDGSKYELAEIEAMVDDQAHVEEAIEKIDAFAREHGLNFEPVRGKTVQYLATSAPEHYKALVEAGVIRG